MSIYLDHAATTPLRPEVLEGMLPHLLAAGSNPSGMYRSAREAKRVLEEARRTVAGCIGAAPTEIYFTSGGTEANNWALNCLMPPAGRLLTSLAEHPSVLESARHLQAAGYQVSYLPVDASGSVNLDALAGALKSKPDLVSLIYANNEVGTISPVAEIAALCRAAGVPLHMDAVAAAGKIPIHVKEQGISLLSASAHKFYGPRGMGFLYISNVLRPAAMLRGGHQERSLRPGTENVAGAAAMAHALHLACREMQDEHQRLSRLRRYLRQQLKEIPGVRINGSPENILPSTLHLTLPGIRSEAALIFFDSRDIACGAGAACSLGAHGPSHVLLAMGQTPQEAACALRLSFGRETCQEDLDVFLTALRALIRRHRNTGNADRLYPSNV